MKKVFRWLSAALCVFLCATFLPVAAFGAPSCSVTPVPNASSAAPGSTVTVTLNFKASESIEGVNGSMTFASDIFDFVSVKNGVAEAVNREGNTIYFSYGPGAKATSGQLLTLTLKVKSAASLGSKGSIAVTKSVVTTMGLEKINGTNGSATVTVAQAKSENNYLATLDLGGIALDDPFRRGVTEYSAHVPYETDSLRVNASPEDDGAKVSGTGTHALKVGANYVVVKVTAANGQVRQYNIVVTRAAAPASSSPVSATSRPPASSSAGSAVSSSSAEESQEESSSEVSAPSHMEEVSSGSSEGPSSEEPAPGVPFENSYLFVHIFYIACMIICLAAGCMLGYFIRGKRQ